jgi:hypothetical protein
LALAELVMPLRVPHVLDARGSAVGIEEDVEGVGEHDRQPPTLRARRRWLLLRWAATVRG